jgi:hypothetical protein
MAARCALALSQPYQEPSLDNAFRGNRHALHALTLLIARQLLHELHGLESDIEYFVVPPLCPLLGSPYDFSQTNKLIDRATESTRTWLAEEGLTRRAIPNQMHTQEQDYQRGHRGRC